MVRSCKTSAFEDVIGIIGRLPCWLGLLLALLSWYWLPGYTTSPLPGLIDSTQLSGHITGNVFNGFTTAFQYIIHAACTAGALAYLFGRIRRRRLLEDIAAQTQTSRKLENICWQELERLIGEAPRSQGYRITETGGNVLDGGVDLGLHNQQNEKYIVQCEQWRALKAGVPVIREFLGAMIAEGAISGFVASSCTFLEEANTCASRRNIRLIHGRTLNTWNATAKCAQIQLSPKTSQLSPAADGAQEKPESSNCQGCNSAMKRTADKKVTHIKGFLRCAK